jgi:acetyltransferase-like isoleucine patch superfamily enzyme
MSNERNIDDSVVVGTGTIGLSYRENSTPPRIGEECIVRKGTIIYDDVVIGDRLQTGHYALVREDTNIGDDVIVGTHTVLDGAVNVGDAVSMQTGVYVPRYTSIGNRVFLGPSSTLLNDMFPVRQNYELRGPTIRDDVSIGANATILPDVTVGERALVAEGSVVNRDVPPDTLDIGATAEMQPLTEKLNRRNDLSVGLQKY